MPQIAKSQATSPKAVGIVSGGLDSLLAVEVVRRMGFEVLALHFVVGYELGHLRTWLADPSGRFHEENSFGAMQVRVEVADIREDFQRLLADPPHGFGRNHNPCIDCKILMLSKARERMEQENAAFVFTGEVLGQRPMSQNRHSLDKIEKAAGLKGRLLRPLCGARLPPTQAEEDGLFSRSQLFAIEGRSRKEQMELAEQLGISDYPSPAGGCLLTDPQYARRLRDWLKHRGLKKMTPDESALLLIGRHIRLPAGGKAIIGRHQADNDGILRFSALGGLMEAVDVPGPTTLLLLPMDATDIQAAGQLTARYGKGQDQDRVNLQIRWPDGRQETIESAPGEPEGIHII